MPTAALPLIGSGISAGAGLIGAGKASRAQNQASQASQGYYNAETQAIQQLLSNYFQYAPTLENNLLNFKDQQQPEIQQLANSEALGNQSLVRSLRSQVGGGANPNQVLGGLSRDLMQNNLNNTQQMESQLVGQQLNAYDQLGSLISSPLQASIGGLNNMGNQAAAQAASYGNPYGSAMGGIGSFLNQLIHASVKNTSTTTTPPPTPGVGGGAGIGGLGNGGYYNTNPYNSGPGGPSFSPPPAMPGIGP